MKTAFLNYFHELQILYEKTFGSRPTISYTKELNPDLLVGNQDEDGEIQWVPIKQTKDLDWDFLMRRLGFSLREEIKEYYTTFFFLMLSGSYNGCKLNFYCIDGSKPVELVIIRAFEDAQYIFPKQAFFLIGNAVVHDDDNYFILYDNNTGRLFCYDSETQKEIVLSNSIADVIGNMEASI